MNTAEQKAIELVAKFEPHARFKTKSPVGRKENAKACALICVDEIIQSHKYELTGWNITEKEKWESVKKAIEKL